MPTKIGNNLDFLLKICSVFPSNIYFYCFIQDKTRWYHQSKTHKTESRCNYV